MSAATEAEARLHEVDDNESTDAAAPLDLLLSDAATSPIRRFLPGMSGVRFTAGLARRPQRVAGRTLGLAAELAKIGVGRSELEPHEKDRRFAEEAWAKNPLFKRTLQCYLATGDALRGLVEDAELGWGDEQRMGFIVDNLVEASAPSNNPFLNPKVLKRIIDTGGGNLVDGGRRFVRDFATAPRVPSMVEPDAFEVGTDIAVTPGAVVLRTDVFELIQYTPQTAKVREVPLLIVPPTINKYYVIDLAEQRSLVEHLVAGGQQVYCISWRNPDARHADWGLDTYGQAILEAMDAAQKIARQDQIAMLGICSGGMIASMVLAHLAANGDLDRVAAFSLAVTVLDQEQAGLPSALLSHKAAAASTRASPEKGYLDGRVLAEMFAWLRPNDLIWNYWVNNYLLGHAPKAFDILYWNADPVRMTAAMHRDFMDLAISNGLTRAGETKMLGHRGRPRQDRHRHLRRGRDRRPPVQVGVLLPDHPAARRRLEVRALHQRPHRRDGQPARQPEGELPDGLDQPRRRRGLARQGLEGQGQLVGRLRRLAGRAHRPGAQQAEPARLRGVRAALRRARHLCP